MTSLATVTDRKLGLVIDLYGAPGPTGAGLAPAVAATAVGTVRERWLFFAEGDHVVRLYYGADRA